LRVRLDGRSDPPVGVSLSKHGVDGRPHDGPVPLLDVPFGIRSGFDGIERNVVPLGAQFGNAVGELVERGGNVGELDDVAFGRLGELAQIGQVVGNALAFVELFGEGRQDPSRHGNVARDNVDARQGRELGNDRVETVGGEGGGLVGFGVNDRPAGAGDRVVPVVGGGRVGNDQLTVGGAEASARNRRGGREGVRRQRPSSTDEPEAGLVMMGKKRRCC
jgi:hypothetical protein